MKPPTLTPEQRRTALEKAAAVRKGRAEIKTGLARRCLTIPEILGRVDDPLVGGMRTSAVLMALPGIGKKRSARILQRVGIAPNRRLRGLTARQRDALVDELA